MTYRWRWLVMGVFPVFWLSVDRSLGGAGIEFAVLTILNAAACALLVARLGQPLHKTLWAWVLLAVLVVAYLTKMAWIAARLGSPRYMGTFHPELGFVDRGLIVDAYWPITVGFVSAAVTMAVALGIRMAGPRAATAAAGVDRTAVLHLLTASVLVFSLAAVVAAATGGAMLGQSTPDVLPRPVEMAVNFVLRDLSLPVMLLCLWALDRVGSGRSRLAVMALVCTGVVTGVVTTSRGAVLFVALATFFLFALTSRLTTTRKAAVAAVAAVAVVIFPTLSAARYSRLSGGDARWALASPAQVVEAGASIAMRPPGAAGMWNAQEYLKENGRPPVTRLIDPRGMRDFYTYSVVGLDRAGDFRAPGILAALFLLSDRIPVFAFLVAMFVMAVRLLWGGVGRLAIAPVALAVTALAILGWSNEGTLQWPSLLRLILALALCNVAYHRLLMLRREPEPAGAEEREPEPELLIPGLI